MLKNIYFILLDQKYKCKNFGTLSQKSISKRKVYSTVERRLKSI